MKTNDTFNGTHFSEEGKSQGLLHINEGNKGSRRERRQEARDENTQFVPQYRAPVQTHEEATGVGYERFNTRFTTFVEVDEDSKYYHGNP